MLLVPSEQVTELKEKFHDAKSQKERDKIEKKIMSAARDCEDESRRQIAKIAHGRHDNSFEEQVAIRQKAEEKKQEARQLRAILVNSRMTNSEF